MKIVLNKCYGSFSLSQYAADLLGVDTYCDPDEVRYDSQLMAYIEAFGSERISGNYAKLEIIKIPDNYTDYELDEYDGIERITYVVDGKIYHA